jgi:hypothetical protein
MTVTVHKNHSTINVGSNDDDIVTGHDDTILVGSNSILTARGSALSVQVSGAGSVVRIGGNGVDASNADDNVVVFNGVGGALHELANARVDVTTAHTRLTMAGDDALGVYGRGDTVTASGVDDAIWIGQNGFGMTGGAIDFVNSLTYGAVFEMAGSTVSTNGAYYAVTLVARDMLTATGLGVNVTITAAGDILTIGANGASASNTDEDVVLFQAAGTINLFADSRVDTTGNFVTANLASDDTFGLYGSDDTVFANGTGDQIWIGQNGMGSPHPADDLVHGLTDGALNEMQGSDVDVDGTNYTAAMSGDDTLIATGSGVSVGVTGTNNYLLASNSHITAADGASFFLSGSDDTLVMSDASVSTKLGSSFDLFGDNNAVDFTGGGEIQILGGGNNVSVGQGSTVVISQNHDPNISTDVVQWGDAPIAPISVLGNTLASLSGSSAVINLSGSEISVVVTGSNDSVTETYDYSGNAITIGGNGSTYGAAGQDSVTLNPSDYVTLLANSNVAVNTVAGVASNQDAVFMAANDSLSIGAGVTVNVGLGLGDDYLANFASTDALKLAAHFNSVYDLLAHTGLNAQNETTIQLDANGDTLSLGISKTALASYARQGLITFS